MAGNSRNIFAAVLFAAAVAASASLERRAAAQTAPDEATITGFSLPEMDDAGELKWKVLGEQARMKPNGPMDISGLRVEWFRSNQVDMVLMSPRCLYSREQREAVTESPVRIQGKDMLITGDGFYWSGTNNLLVIRNNAHVYMTNTRMPGRSQTNNAATGRSPMENHK